METKKLAREIVLYLNDTNKGLFTESELEQFTNDFIYSLENGESENIINSLEDEFNCSYDIRVLSFIERIKELKGSN